MPEKQISCFCDSSFKSGSKRGLVLLKERGDFCCSLSLTTGHGLVPLLALIGERWHLSEFGELVKRCGDTPTYLFPGELDFPRCLGEYDRKGDRLVAAISGDRFLFCTSGEDAVSFIAHGEVGDHNSREHSETQGSGSGVAVFSSGEEQMSFSSENGVVFLVSVKRLELSGLLIDRQSGDWAMFFISFCKTLQVIPLLSGDSPSLPSNDTMLYVTPVICGEVILLKGDGVLLGVL